MRCYLVLVDTVQTDIRRVNRKKVNYVRIHMHCPCNFFTGCWGNGGSNNVLFFTYADPEGGRGS